MLPYGTRCCLIIVVLLPEGRAKAVNSRLRNLALLPSYLGIFASLSYFAVSIRCPSPAGSVVWMATGCSSNTNAHDIRL